MWYEKIIAGLTGPQVVNDSKTPSGRVHVGSLRGVILHDVLHRALRAAGLESRFLYGIDDCDPLDGLPDDAPPELRARMGEPLHAIPAPEGSTAGDFAAHCADEFTGLFAELGVDAEVYRMRDLYRSGRLNESIDAILRNAAQVRAIYAETSGSERPADWHPCQIVCERCGKVGTTAVTAYDGREATYRCRTDLVSWAVGCGHVGKVAPFDGRGKLPWKLEWVAKWRALGVTLEGAGKDHCTRGGARDVAERCLRAIFGQRPPRNAPYEFFLVSGAKMSSSKGVGAAARDMVDFLPAELVRLLMVRAAPRRTVNFSTDFDYIVKLFNEYDRLRAAERGGNAAPDQQKLLQMVAAGQGAWHPVGFQLLTALLQLPHIDIAAEIERRLGDDSNDSNDPNDDNAAARRAALERRIAAARYWLDHCAAPEERVQLQERLPESARALSAAQRAFLHRLADELPDGGIDDEAGQRLLFDAARRTPLEQPRAFAALYRVLLDRDSGPKGGALLSWLNADFLRRRFRQLNFSVDAYWAESAMAPEAGEQWLAERCDQLVAATARLRLHSVVDAASARRGSGVVEIEATLNDKKRYLLRLLLHQFSGAEIDLEAEAARTMQLGEALIDRLTLRIGIPIWAADDPERSEERIDAGAPGVDLLSSPT